MRLAFGALIAIVLLGLYVYAVFTATAIVECIATKGCTTLQATDFTDGMVQAMSVIGGLVSALVIAELSVTEPGKPPVERALSAESGTGAKRFVQIVTLVYLLVWTYTGFWAFLVGVMQHPKVLQPLTDLGNAWLGLAVAAGYAYFGIKPKN